MNHYHDREQILADTLAERLKSARSERWRRLTFPPAHRSENRQTEHRTTTGARRDFDYQEPLEYRMIASNRGMGNTFGAKTAFQLMATVIMMLCAAVLPAQEDGEGPAAPAGNGNARVTVATNDGRVDSVLAVISTQIEGTVSPFGKVPGSRVTIIAEEQPVETVLNMLANPNGWVWWREDNGDYGIADREYYERNILPKRVIQKVFRPNNIKASELDRAIKGLLTPNVGSSVADDRTNKLIVNDLPQALERIERFIREIDVQLVVRVFYIRHADVEDIAKKIENYKSDPGTIEVDTKTHQIIVTDLLSNIKKMELLIDILDVGPEIVIYDVNNIGIEGTDLEDLQNIIETIRTDDETLLFEVNEKQGVFILEDVPEVHERVEQILAGFDQPVKQVLIQGEILSTKFERNFNFGLTQFASADQLLSASNQGALGSGAFGRNLEGNNNSGSGDGDVTGLDFANIYDIFPNIAMTGSTVTGNYLNNDVLVQYEATFQDTSTRVLLQPRVLVKNQQTSRIFVGAEEPYLTTYYDDNVSGNSRRTTSQSTVTSGLTFEVTPSISNSYLIELELQIDNDEAQPVDVPDGQNTVRLIRRDRQQVETTLQIPSGETRVIGGLIRNTDSDGSSGLPFLSSLPWIGALFGTKTSSKSATNLMIFITPSIVEDVLPRPTTQDGRRGRLVTDYERVPGEFDLDLDAEDQQGEGTGEFDIPENFEDLLSGSEEEEQATLEMLREIQRKRQEALEEDAGASNYVPTAGLGSTTLNANDDRGAATPRDQIRQEEQRGPGTPVQPESRREDPRQNREEEPQVRGETETQYR